MLVLSKINLGIWVKANIKVKDTVESEIEVLLLLVKVFLKT